MSNNQKTSHRSAGASVTHSTHHHARPSVAVHKFSSCDGCQLAFLNMGESLLTLSELVDIRHFAEAGPVDTESKVDIAFVEGSISTPDDLDRIRKIRDNSNYLVTMGACATAGGIQALRNFVDADTWVNAIYASPEYIHTLDKSTPIKDHVKVDFELWGCPVNKRQIVTTIRALLFYVTPVEIHEKVCMECKRLQATCVMVTKGEPCMGPVTRTGCGALCPRFGRACYACYGPGDSINTSALSRRFSGLGLPDELAAQRFLFINSNAEAFTAAGQKLTSGNENDA